MLHDKHIMIDLETLDTRVSAHILSVGAVLFCPGNKGDVVEDTFYAVVGGEQGGRSISFDTVQWWMGQNEQARNAAFTGPRVGLRAALSGLSEVVTDWASRPTSGGRPVTIWAKDPDFDCAILTHAFCAEQMPTPWPFWCTRSVRTILDLGGAMGIDIPTYVGTHHNALDDARSQAEQVSAVIRGLAK